METVTVDVRQSHIRAGRPAMRGGCAIALALIAHNYSEVTVDSEKVTFSRGLSDRRYVGALSKRAQNFIDRFDRLPAKERRAMKPFRFRLAFQPKEQSRYL